MCGSVLAAKAPAEVKDLEPAQLVTYVKAVVPPGAKEGEAHMVAFRAKLGPDGRLREFTPATADDPMTAPAREAAAQWVYVPYRRDGQPVGVEVFLLVMVGATEHVAAPKQPVPVSMRVGAQLLEHMTRPMHPEIGVRGTVLTDVTIGKDGAVKTAQAMSGPGPLRDEAMGWIPEWKFLPFLLDGVPVEVKTTMRVQFDS